jgi:uncharacterized membrane-anchored protein
VTALRLESLSSPVARTTQLLSTRVDLTREHQKIAVLESMNRRADLKLRLQQFHSTELGNMLPRANKEVSRYGPISA